MTKWASFYSTEYLTAEALDENGRTATIAAVDAATLRSEEGGEEHSAAAVTFKETSTRWLVNKINRLCLEAMFGANVEDAIGHKVTLFSDSCEIRGQYFGKPCIRILGSPELKAPLTVTIKLPKRKPFTRTLMPTGKTPPPDKGAAPAVEPETGEVFDGYEPEEAVSGAETAAMAFADAGGGTRRPDSADTVDDDLSTLDAFSIDAAAAKAQRAAQGEHGGISPQQMRALMANWSALETAGYTEAQLREQMAVMTGGKTSRKALTIDEASAVINSLANELAELKKRGAAA